MDRLKMVLLPAALLAALGCGDDHAGDPNAGGAADAGAADASVREAFSIALSTSDCLSGCAAYDLKLDQGGVLDFNGRGHTRAQGWIGKQVTPETAAELLQLLRAADYWQLADVYRSASDGCKEVSPDSATYTWNIATEGRAKIVVDYQGCTGVSELDALRQIPDTLRDRLMLEPWIGY